MPQPNLESLSSEIAQLKQMLEAITLRLASMEGAATQAAPAPPPPEAGISEETLLAIAAAVAAYLGHKPKIKQIRLVRTANWAQEGRVSIQASHRISVQR
jgi:methylmalonyl-CoA carboxyltransferase large subunit